MKVLLWHLDGKLPNLALMRLAAHHRALGDQVELREAETAADLQPRLGDPTWDHVYGSLIFEWTRPLALEAQRIYPGLELGGTGWDFEDGVQIRRTDLPVDVAAAAPDYSVYPWFANSIGFAQRGCRFRCSFCVVPRKEGKVVSVSELEAIWRGGDHPRRVILLDNDFFGNPYWREVIADAKRLDIAIAVIQGINARTLKDEQAAAIAGVHWMADDFTRRRVYMAWDNENDERTFFRGLDRLKAHGISPDSMLVYMLIGHAPGETHADRDRRRAKLREYGAGRTRCRTCTRASSATNSARSSAGASSARTSTCPGSSGGDARRATRGGSAIAGSRCRCSEVIAHEARRTLGALTAARRNQFWGLRRSEQARRPARRDSGGVWRST